MQTIARVVQDFCDTATLECWQAVGNASADQAGGRALLPVGRVRARSKIVTLEPLKSLNRIIQTSRRHAPGTYRCANQIDLMVSLHQPVTKNEAIQRPENQPLGPTRRSRYDFDHFRLQALLLYKLPGFAAGIDA